jgi:hypothetical protein
VHRAIDAWASIQLRLKRETETSSINNSFAKRERHEAVRNPILVDGVSVPQYWSVANESCWPLRDPIKN